MHESRFEAYVPAGMDQDTAEAQFLAVLRDAKRSLDVRAVFDWAGAAQVPYGELPAHVVGTPPRGYWPGNVVVRVVPVRAWWVPPSAPAVPTA